MTPAVLHDTFNTCSPETGAKPRWPYDVALAIADELLKTLEPACERIVIAGSLRRRKPDVGDIELLYVPAVETQRDPNDMFASREINLADEVIRYLEAVGDLERRKNVKGSEVFGPKNKLLRHRRSGINVDLFAATQENWFNYLVCRTGPAESNLQIAMRARERGWKWNPYGVGFSRGGPLSGGADVHAVHSEREVFEFVGLPYAEPWERR